MRISDVVTQYILELLDESNGYAEIQRNELANLMGCVPSQINYVLTSRFTPEQGYIIESRRGGGGYIKIKKIKMDKSLALMHIINSIGDKLDSNTCQIILNNLVNSGTISLNNAKLTSCACSNRCYSGFPVNCKDYLRANLFKNMLLLQSELDS